jgi:hypothetical protein
MKKTAKIRKESRIKREFNRRLLNYSMAAGTTLALATPATAAIRYSGVKSQVIDNDVFELDMQDVIDGKPDGNPDFSFADIHTNYTSTSAITTTGGKHFLVTYAFKGSVDFMVPAISGNAFAADSTTTYYPKVAFFQKGDRVGPDAANFVSDTLGLLDKYFKIRTHSVNTTNPSETYDYSQKLQTGNFGGKKGYIGVRFFTAAKPITAGSSSMPPPQPVTGDHRGLGL